MKAKVIKTGEVVDVYHEPQHGQITNIYKESVLVNGRMWIEDELDFCIKSNEAPKKLYLQPSTIKQLPHQNIVYIIPLTDNSVEYIRTDAFIEKACEWLKNNIEKYYYLDEAYDKVISIKTLNSDFKKAMKGE